MRVFALSDLHVDYPENLEWVLSLSGSEYRDDVLILAGDVSDRVEHLQQVFASLRSKFKDVHFVPGNHELWVDSGPVNCSLEKLALIEKLCDQEGIKREVSHYGGLSLVPLLGWYDFSFGEVDRYLERGWRDFRSCKWPAELDSSEAIAAYFHDRNESSLETSNSVVISYSHFVPRIDVMPSRIPHERRKVYPVLGSEKLGEQVRRLNPNIHVYGHSHVNQSIELDGVCYINNAFAYPREDRISRKQMHCVLDLSERLIQPELAGQSERDNAKIA